MGEVERKMCGRKALPFFFPQWEGNLAYFLETVSTSLLCRSPKKCMIVTNGTLLERVVNNLSRDTGFNVNDEVTTEI